MILPSYNTHSHGLKQIDFDKIMSSQNTEELCHKIYSCDIETFMRLNTIRNFVQGPVFRDGADYFESEEFITVLSSIIQKIHFVASECGFPGRSSIKQASKIDIALTKALYEILEQSSIKVVPSQASSRFFQQFMTQRIFPLVTFWRWKVVTGNSLSKDRVIFSPRNYFYTLWVSGYLFDRGIESQDERWSLLENMSADSLVQIIERSGIGYRKGFAQAIATERKRRSASTSGSLLDTLVRGCMKRASFTFATSVMPDNEDYYKKIVEYLFHWSELNYKPVTGKE